MVQGFSTYRWYVIFYIGIIHTLYITLYFIHYLFISTRLLYTFLVRLIHNSYKKMLALKTVFFFLYCTLYFLTLYNDYILDDHKKYIVRKREDNHQLEIKNLTHQDTGEYTCKVTQKALSYYTYKRVYLTVQRELNPCIYYKCESL